MFFGFWQFKTTVSLLLLASCLGQELIRTCDRDYCYELPIERRNIREDHLREWHRGERLYGETELKHKFNREHTDNRRDVIRGVRENRLEISDLESRRLNSRRESVENPREIDSLTLNRRETREEEPIRLRNENRIMIVNSNALAAEDRNRINSRRDFLAVDKLNNNRDNDRRFDETRRTERFSESTFKGTEILLETECEKCSVTSRRLSETRHDLELRELRDINKANRKSRRLNERTTDEKLNQLQGTFDERIDNEEPSNRREDLTTIDLENQRDNLNDFRLANYRVFENERHPELSERDEFRQLPLRELNSLDNFEHRLNERERLTENRRLSKKFAEDGNRQKRDNRLERNYKERESLRRLTGRENQRSKERLSRTDLEKETVKRIEVENQRDNTNDIRFVNRRVFENERRLEVSERDESLQLRLRELATLDESEHRLNEYERLTENLRLPEERHRQKRDNSLERNHELRRPVDRFSETERLTEIRENLMQLSQHENQRSSERRHNINRQSLNLNERLDRYAQRLSQLNNNNEQELNERDQVSTQRRTRNTRGYPDNQARNSESDTETKQRELNARREVSKINKRIDQGISSGLNDRFKRRYENLRKLQNSISKNSRLAQSEKERFANHDETQRNIREHLNLNQESRRMAEKEGILLDADIESRRSKMVRELVARRYDNVRQIDERREVLGKFEEHEGKRDSNRAFNENHLSRRFDKWNLEKNEKNRIENESTRKNNDNESNGWQDNELLEHSSENKRERNAIQRSNYIRQVGNPNYRDFYYLAAEHIQKPTVSSNKGYMALGQGALLAYIIMKTLNGKNIKKHNIYQKLQEAIALKVF